MGLWPLEPASSLKKEGLLSLLLLLQPFRWLLLGKEAHQCLNTAGPKTVVAEVWRPQAQPQAQQGGGGGVEQGAGGL